MESNTIKTLFDKIMLT